MAKPDKARKVIHVYLKATDEHHYFGSLSALYVHFTPDQLNVSIQTLYNQFKGDTYQNAKIILRKGRLIQKKHDIEGDVPDISTNS